MKVFYSAIYPLLPGSDSISIHPFAWHSLSPSSSQYCVRPSAVRVPIVALPRLRRMAAIGLRLKVRETCSCQDPNAGK